MYKINDVITATVFQVQPTHFLVKTDDNWTGLVHVSQVSDYFVQEKTNPIKNGDNLKLKVLDVNRPKMQMKLSYKALNPAFMKNPFKYEMQETEKGFKNLKTYLEKRIKND